MSVILSQSYLVKIPALFSSSTSLLSSGCCREEPQTVGLEQQMFVSPSSGGWESKVKVPTDSVPGESSLPGCTTPFLLCPPGGERQGCLFLA